MTKEFANKYNCTRCDGSGEEPEATPSDAAGAVVITSGQREIIEHCQKAGQGCLSGLFITGLGSADYEDCLSLVASGHMDNLGKHPFCSDTTFRITGKGREANRKEL